MTSDGFCYRLPTGDYAIEGFVFAIRGNDGECVMTPERMLGPPDCRHEGNLITLKAVISGKGVHSEQFGSEIRFEGPASMFAYLLTDIERLRSGEDDSLVFPSMKVSRFAEPWFECRIDRDRHSLTGWSMHCRCATPRWWKGNLPPAPSECEHGRFAGTLSVLMAFDADSLEVVRSDVTSFLRWLDDPGGTEEKG